MATNSHIEWTDATWNPVTGCTKISPGCKHCYAERMAHRLQVMGQSNYRNGFKVTLQPQMLERPLQWRAPNRIFVNSMSDLFHVDVPLDYIQQVFATMNRALWHQYQVLTKRADRLEELSAILPWSPHIWMGVSVENAKNIERIDSREEPGGVGEDVESASHQQFDQKSATSRRFLKRCCTSATPGASTIFLQ